MIGVSYLPGALAVAWSLRRLRTRHALVCMATPDVPAGARAQLGLVYDRVVEVPYVAHKARPLPSLRQAEYYAGWLDRGFTKWNCLELAEYDRVLLVDADVVFLVNSDDLFDLRPPAACFSLPWAAPWQREGGLANPYLAALPAQADPPDLPHGCEVPAAAVMAALHARTFVGGGFLVLLEPRRGKLAELVALIGAGPVYGAGYRTTSAADETAIAELYARAGTPWTHIHQRYAAIPWKKDWVARDIRAYHYLGRKPWESSPLEWPDLADWWRVADGLVAAHGGLRGLFYPDAGAVAPLDADAAQLRLTGDARALVLGAGREHGKRREQRAAWREADNVLGRWLMALVNTPGPAESYVAWAQVYRRSAPGEPFNRKLAAELTEKGFVRTEAQAHALVAKILETVDLRLDRPPRPSGVAPACGGGALSYGSHFETPETARLARLVELGGCAAAVAVALRYAVVIASGQQWGIPRAHAAYLYDRFRVRGEAFASPLNARLLGMPGARFCSAFPDTDAPFGSAGDFFAQDPATLDGNWVVNPPFVEELLLRAARHLLGALEAGALQTFFYIMPAWTDTEAYGLLAGSPFLVAERRLEPGQYYYEDPAGARVDTKAASLYLALSTESAEARARLPGALEHITAV
jgi:glycogenin glucosyltransferase